MKRKVVRTWQNEFDGMGHRIMEQIKGYAAAQNVKYSGREIAKKIGISEAAMYHRFKIAKDRSMPADMWLEVLHHYGALEFYEEALVIRYRPAQLEQLGSNPKNPDET